MIRSFNRLLQQITRDSRGNITIVAAVAMPVVLGSLGLGAEVASWYGGKRALQNAADSAAIAAATNASDSYGDEARAVAAQYGFRDGVDGVTVNVSNTAPCPDGESNCYSVVIDRIQPLLLAQVVGFGGDALGSDGSPAKLISAKAVAMQTDEPREYCILALAGSGESEGIRTNGAPKADLTGCSVMSNTNAQCNGHDLKADFGDAHGTNDGCGRKRTSNVDIVEDPYASLRDNIPDHSCASYPVAPKKKKDPELPADNLLGGSEARTLIPLCGDVELSSDLLITSGEEGAVMVIKNGRLDLNGHKIRTQEGAALTIVFTGPNDSRTHAPVGNGEFDIQAPKTGPWKGVAIYQDPTLTNGVNISEAGNSPAWNITGLVYLPKAAVTFSGVVNKASNGDSCFALVVDHLLVNGTAEILAHGECPRAGLDLPASQQPSRGRLVS